MVSQKGWISRPKTETFQQRLSSKHGLTEESARRLVEEYRRFLYLKVIDGGSLTPSKHVDQAWHLHMETPGGEWTRFCDEVLKFRIDHQTGLSESKAQANYARLLHLYRREFNHEPPSDIWPGERETRQRTIGIGMNSVGFVLIILGAIFWEPYLGGFGPLVGVVGGLALMILGGKLLKGTDLEKVANCA